MSRKRQLTQTLQRAITSALANTHTNTLAVVTAVNEFTLDCQPVINRVVDGEERQLPTFPDVPPIFLGGADGYTAHGVAVGDYVLLVISERCFDNWYKGNDFQRPRELRMHDYSDAFALVGIRNESGQIPIPEPGESVSKGNRTHNGNLIVNGNSSVSGDQDVNGTTTSGGYASEGQTGVTNTFATGDGRTATVTNGIITNIV